MSATPAVLSCMKPSDFLHYIQRHHVPLTTVVICSPREAFLEALYASLTDTDIEGETSYAISQSLLVPTIHQLSISSTVNVAFVATLAHLRAYLATLRPGFESHPEIKNGSSSHVRPMLAIYGLLNLHVSTSDYSAQGLSRTLAIAVEAATAVHKRLLMAEHPTNIVNQEPTNATGNDSIAQANPWKHEIPLLNGSIRHSGESTIWSGRTVEAVRVVSRWCDSIQLETDG